MIMSYTIWDTPYIWSVDRPLSRQVKKFNINKILSSLFYQVTESSSAATPSNNPDPDTSTVSISTLDQPLMDSPLSVAKEKQKQIGVSPVSKVGKLLLQIGLLGYENSF